MPAQCRAPRPACPHPVYCQHQKWRNSSKRPVRSCPSSAPNPLAASLFTQRSQNFTQVPSTNQHILCLPLLLCLFHLLPLTPPPFPSQLQSHWHFCCFSRMLSTLPPGREFCSVGCSDPDNTMSDAAILRPLIREAFLSALCRLGQGPLHSFTPRPPPPPASFLSPDQSTAETLQIVCCPSTSSPEKVSSMKTSASVFHRCVLAPGTKPVSRGIWRINVRWRVKAIKGNKMKQG